CSDRPIAPCKHPCDDPAYPSGPYGATKDSVVEDLPIRVWHDMNRNGMVADDPPGAVRLADYRNRFLAGGPRLLVAVSNAYWCGPCQMMQPSLVEWHRRYRGDVTFLDVLFQKQDQSSADDADVTAWANRFALPFDIGRPISDGDLDVLGLGTTFPTTTMI